MDPKEKSTEILKGLLYALVIIIVLAISLRGSTVDIVHIAKKLTGKTSQNAYSRNEAGAGIVISCPSSNTQLLRVYT